MYLIVYMQCGQFTSELSLKGRRSAYIWRVLTKLEMMSIRAMPCWNGTQICPLLVSITAEHCENAAGPHDPTLNGPNLNLRRTGMR